MARSDKQEVLDLRNVKGDRRKFLTWAGSTVGVGTLMALAGCSGQSGDGASSPADGGDTSGDGGDGGDGGNGGDDGSDGETDSSQSDSGGPKRGGRLILTNDLLFELWDQRRSSIMNLISGDVFDTLVMRDYQGRFAPGLATDWSFENDNMDIVFQLREGVTFHDGSTFDAEHVKWFLTDFLMNGSGTAYIVDGIVEDVVVDDAHTARVKLAKPSPNLIWNLSSEWGYVHSREAVEEHGESYGQNVAVGTGPYQLKSRDGDTNAVVERFEDYDWTPEWVGDLDGSGRAQEIEWRVITETATMTGAFEAGDVDAIEHATPYNKVASYKSNNNFQFSPQPAVNTMNFMQFNLNPDTTPFPALATDLNLRKALSYAVDREALVQGLYSGSAMIGKNYLPPAVPSHDVPEENNYTYQPDKAVRLMEESGWTVNPGGVSEKDGTKAQFTLLTKNKTMDARRGTAISQMWRDDLGVKVNVQTRDTATFKNVVGAGDAAMWVTNGKWANADLLWWRNHSDMMGEWHRHSRAPVQFPEVDEKIDAAMNAETWEDRIAKFKEAHIWTLQNVVPMIMEVYPIKGDSHWNHIKEFNSHYQATPHEPVWSSNW